MRRIHILCLGILLGTLGVALSMGSAGYLAWTLLLKNTERRLETLAGVAARRAEGTYREAAGTLRSLVENLDAPCTADGIEHMRLLALNTLSVKAIGYVEEEVFACSSWGSVRHLAVAPRPADFTTADGVRVAIGVRPQLVRGRPMMALQYAAFNVLVDTRQFVEVADDDARLAVGTREGHWISSSDTGAEALLALAHVGPRAGLAEGYLYSRVVHGDWVAMAAVSRGELLADLRREELLVLPFGLLLSLVCVWLAWRYTRRRLSPYAQLRRGLREGQFIVHYQPIVELASGRCTGAEALVRWRRDDGRLVMPDRFMPLAERSGLVRPLTEQVLAAVLRDLGPTLAADPELRVSLNVPAADISSGRILHLLERAWRDANLRSGQLWLEVTEDSLLDLEHARSNLGAARAAGYQVALDDFGTGYSNLQYLRGLPLDVLKIDRSFVEPLRPGERICPVTEHIIQLAGALRLDLVAEGVETTEQLAVLRERKVRYAQGWLFAKALPAAEFLDYYRHCQPPVA